MEKAKIKALCFMVIMLMMTQTIQADNYKILCLSQGVIKINGRVATKNMVFSDADMIEWSSDNQGMRVINLSSKKVMMLAAKKFQQIKAQSISDHVSQIQHLSTRTITNSAITDTTLFLLDTLLIEAGPYYGGKVSERYEFYVGQQKYSGRIARTSNKKHFIVTRSIFGVQTPKAIFIDIYGIDTSRLWSYPIYLRQHIIPLPLKN